MADFSKAEEAQIQRIQEGLKCSREEALEVFGYDKAIDKAKVKDRLEHDLPLDKEKEITKIYRSKERKPTVYNFNQRERKANPTKGGIISELERFFKEGIALDIQNLEVTNKERQLIFECAGNKYELNLVQKRAPKN
jgi:hypothetical protein